MEVETEAPRWQDLIRDRADHWNAMCSAVALTDEEGLQPFTVPSGWMGSVSPPPTQAYTPQELSDEIEGNEPALYSLLDAVADRAPSLMRTSALLPLARLAAWTDSSGWVRPLAEWPGDGGESAAADSTPRATGSRA